MKLALYWADGLAALTLVVGISRALSGDGRDADTTQLRTTPGRRLRRSPNK